MFLLRPGENSVLCDSNGTLGLEQTTDLIVLTGETLFVVNTSRWFYRAD